MTQLRDLWAQGKPVLNGWLSIGNAFTAEIMAAQGYDSVTIDVQHGALDYSSALPMLQAMRASGVVPMARAPWREPGIIMKLLDAGALGIVCPMVNTAEEAAEFVSFLRYPPRGQRSFGPTRVGVAHGLAAYARDANDLVLGFAQIETSESMANLDAIAATPGLDGLYVGPADLALGLSDGRLSPGFDREEPEMIDAIKEVLAAAHRHGIKACLHCGTPDYAARAVGWGFDLVTVSGDSRLLAAAASASVAKFRELAAQGEKPVAVAAEGGY
ncbi:HpcH/HpaI aldolase family protein [Rubellimicrobium aerolatum]|uniref:HpcH/HpaI aldolase/citrate lyase family protein n=1 Tax=Rubellimicrobium aerolatum TaxID=490979 RepID=A0ABW0SCX4_9RHOB|nr:aldolase/citrate lyase family protein [Rubellimicrobium aerolatum]MBP1806684.1 4-hydroxy-2-oxoheptanedioate aldolase [Rubellimicrobium aerolatum]